MKAVLWLVFVLLVGCSKENPRIEDVSKSWMPEVFFEVIGKASPENPWITDLKIVDLDGDGAKEVLVCEGRKGELSWMRPAGAAYEEAILETGLAGLASVDVADMDGDGDLDILLGCMGIVTPSVGNTGEVVILVNQGEGRFEKRVVLKDVARVNFVAAGDLDGDGDLDLSVGQFGYHEGEICWLENRGDWIFESHELLDFPGTIHAPCVDLDGDGDLDIAALVSQDHEELYGFFNDGKGSFKTRLLYGSTNRDYGSSGLSVADLDQDGDMDLVYTNGDGFDYATPGSRPWHGVQWLENLGAGNFGYHRIGDFSGAYSPVVCDFDGDGDSDVVVTSGFNDWANEGSVSLGVFLNEGKGAFRKVDLANQPTHIVVADASDMDGDGQMDLVTGGFYFYPPYGDVKRVCIWRQNPSRFEND